MRNYKVVLFIVSFLIFTIYANAQPYYKAKAYGEVGIIEIYLDHKFSSDDYRLISEYECIPYTNEVHQEESVLSRDFFGETIVEIKEIYGKYGKIIIDSQEWWIHMGSIELLSESELQKYLIKQNKKVNRNKFISKISDIYNNSPILFWTLVGILVLVFGLIIRFFVRLSRRCKVCGKWGAVKKVRSNKDLSDITSTTLRKSEQITDIYGKKHTNYYHVPATRKTYDHLDEYECKYCGNKTDKIYTSSKTTED